jgi:putative acetyltransferase
MPANLQLDAVDPAEPDAATLIAALDRELLERYPGMPIHGIDAAGFVQSGGVFLIGRIDGQAVASGAVRPIGERIAEVKRMYVCPEFRGRGLARAVLAALEASAAVLGHRTIRLETGDGQPEAIALYSSAGYRPVPCFGEYALDPRCRCFEKQLPVV